MFLAGVDLSVTESVVSDSNIKVKLVDPVQEKAYHSHRLQQQNIPGVDFQRVDPGESVAQSSLTANSKCLYPGGSVVGLMAVPCHGSTRLPVYT